MNLVPSENNPYGVSGQDFSMMDPLSTVHEIALMRSTLAKAVAEGAPPTIIGQLSTVIGRLSKDYAIQSVRASKMLHVDKVHAILQQVCGDLALAFQDVPDWAERIDRVVGGIDLENSQKQINQLCGRGR